MSAGIHRRPVLAGASASAAAILGAAMPPAASAQSYPSQPITIIVPAAAGGVADVVARVFGARLGETTGASVVVSNRAGGAGVPGTLAAARSAPDGHTLLMAYEAPLATLPHLGPLPYDPERDLIPVVNLVSAPSLLVVQSTMPVTNVAEFIAHLKANPGRVTYASQGVGATGHLAGEMLRLETGVEITHVPYRGAAPAAQDLAAGTVAMMFSVLSPIQAIIQSGRLRVLGVATRERVPFLPGVPTLLEQGLPIEMAAWFGLLAPRGTDPGAVAWLNRQANAIFSAEAVRANFAEQGLLMQLGTPAAFGTFIAAERAKLRTVIQRANITLDQ